MGKNSNIDLEENLITKNAEGEEVNNELLDTTGFFRKLFLMHSNKIINLGDKKHFTTNMLFNLRDSFTSKNNQDFFDYYEARKEKYKDDFYHLAMRYPRKEYILSFIIQCIK